MSKVFEMTTPGGFVLKLHYKATDTEAPYKVTADAPGMGAVSVRLSHEDFQRMFQAGVAAAQPSTEEGATP